MALGACETIFGAREEAEISEVCAVDAGTLLRIRCRLDLWNMYEEYWLVTDDAASRVLFDYTNGILTHWVYGVGGNFQPDSGLLTVATKVVGFTSACGDVYEFQLTADRFVLQRWHHRECPSAGDFESFDPDLPLEEWPLRDPSRMHSFPVP
jgi:hypothetical protein